MRQHKLIPFRVPGFVLLVIGNAVLFGCASTPPASIGSPAQVSEKPAYDISALHNIPPIRELSWSEPLTSLSLRQSTLASVDAIDNVDADLLPALLFSFDETTQEPIEAFPGSGFVEQNIHGFIRQLPLSVIAGDAGIGVVVGQDDAGVYTAGLGWVPVASGRRRVKLSLMRQHVVGKDRKGQWLATLQGESKSLPLLEDTYLQVELALASEDGVAAALGDTMGASVRLAKPIGDGIGYSLNLSQFGGEFRPTGSRVKAGRRRALADIHYTLWSDIQLTGNTSYTEHGMIGEPHRCDYRSHVSATGPLLAHSLPSLKARLETSVLRSLNCAGDVRRNVERWKLSLIEDGWTGWNLRLSLSETDIAFPLAGNTRISRSYHLGSRRDFRLGYLVASFGPELSLHTHTAGDVQRRFNAGFAMDFDTPFKNMNLRMGYETLNGAGELPIQHAFEFDFSVKLDIDV